MSFRSILTLVLGLFAQNALSADLYPECGDQSQLQASLSDAIAEKMNAQNQTNAWRASFLECMEKTNADREICQYELDEFEAWKSVLDMQSQPITQYWGDHSSQHYGCDYK